MGWGGGERLKLGGYGGGNNVDLLKTKSLTLGFERLNSPSRLRNALTCVLFTEKVNFYAHKRVIVKPTILKEGVLK